MDKDKFADLLNDAKGARTMKDFSEICGVNPSTFTRIIQKANKGFRSTELLANDNDEYLTSGDSIEDFE